MAANAELLSLPAEGVYFPRSCQNNYRKLVGKEGEKGYSDEGQS